MSPFSPEYLEALLNKTSISLFISDSHKNSGNVVSLLQPLSYHPEIVLVYSRGA